MATIQLRHRRHQNPLGLAALGERQTIFHRQRRVVPRKVFDFRCDSRDGLTRRGGVGPKAEPAGDVAVEPSPLSRGKWSILGEPRAECHFRPRLSLRP